MYHPLTTSNPSVQVRSDTASSCRFEVKQVSIDEYPVLKPDKAWNKKIHSRSTSIKDGQKSHLTTLCHLHPLHSGINLLACLIRLHSNQSHVHRETHFRSPEALNRVNFLQAPNTHRLPQCLSHRIPPYLTLIFIRLPDRAQSCLRTRVASNSFSQSPPLTSRRLLLALHYAASHHPRLAACGRNFKCRSAKVDGTRVDS